MIRHVDGQMNMSFFSACVNWSCSRDFGQAQSDPYPKKHLTFCRVPHIMVYLGIQHQQAKVVLNIEVEN